MGYSYEYLFFILIVYSFLGWVAEVIAAAFKYGRLMNRGVVNGPVCPEYGLAMVLITIDVHDMASYPFYQLIVCIVIMALFEYVSGVLLYKISGRRFWNYSNEKLNFRGFISVRSVLTLGMAGALCSWFINPFLYITFYTIPPVIMKTALIVLGVILFTDIFVTVAAALKWKLEGDIYGNVVQRLEKTKRSIGNSVFGWVQKRMYKAFPEFEKQEKDDKSGFGIPENRVFAEGVCFNKLIWIFFISAFVGDIVETVFMWITTGNIMSRSSVLYGPFSIVWGLGGACATALLYPLREKNDRYIFIAGTFLGGVYEYTCSVFTEMMFGTVFWDYSHLPFNINGRINLLYCFFWGIAAIFWVKLLYPAASRLIEKIPPVAGRVITFVVITAMIFNMILSGLAIGRYVQRKAGVQAFNAVEEFLDSTYKDEFIERIYPNMKIVH